VDEGEVFPLDIFYYKLFKDAGLKLRNRVIWHFEHGLHCSRRFSGRYETLLWLTKTNRYTFNLDAVRADRRAQTPSVIVPTRPRPVLGALDEARSHGVEVNVFHFLVIFLNAPQSPVEKSGLPKEGRLFSAGIDAKGRADLDRFH
jgi:hypothetical protein